MHHDRTPSSAAQWLLEPRRVCRPYPISLPARLLPAIAVDRPVLQETWPDLTPSDVSSKFRADAVCGAGICGVQVTDRGQRYLVLWSVSLNGSATSTPSLGGRAHPGQGAVWRESDRGACRAMSRRHPCRRPPARSTWASHGPCLGGPAPFQNRPGRVAGGGRSHRPLLRGIPCRSRLHSYRGGIPPAEHEAHYYAETTTTSATTEAAQPARH